MSVVSSSSTKGAPCFIEQAIYPYCLVLVSSSSRFKRDLHKQTRLFHNRIKINKYKLNYRLYLEGVIGSSWTSVLL